MKLKPEFVDQGWYVHLGYLTLEGLNHNMCSKVSPETLAYFKTREEALKAIEKFERYEYKRLKRKFNRTKKNDDCTI